MLKAIRLFTALSYLLLGQMCNVHALTGALVTPKTQATHACCTQKKSCCCDTGAAKQSKSQHETCDASHFKAVVTKLDAVSFVHTLPTLAVIPIAIQSESNSPSTFICIHAFLSTSDLHGRSPPSLA